MQDAGDLSQYSKLRDGCRETTESFVREHAGWMLNVARRFFGNDPVAEDVVQDAFTQALKNIKQFEGRSALKTWLHRIVINQALMQLRTRKRRPEESLDHLLPEFDRNACRIEEGWQQLVSAEDICAQNQLRQLVHAKIASLPESYRSILLLRDIEDFSTAEVADQLGLSEANVKVRLHRARSALKSLLEPILRGDVS